MSERPCDVPADPYEAAEAEEAAALRDWLERESAGETSYIPAGEVRRRLGLEA